MIGQLKLARALAPAALVGLLCGSAVAVRTNPGSPPRIAEPCSPDGYCLPRVETWGWYETRWRPFPGDVVAGPPTEVEADEEEEQDQVGGPQLPQPAQEGTSGPAPRPGAGGAPGATPEGGAVPAPGAGEAPLDAIPAPTFEPAPGTEPAPGATPAPGTVPDPLDPFGAAPKPPGWMQQPVRSASTSPPLAAGAVLPAAVATAPVTHGPNLDGDDAPPALPASLQGALTGAVPRPAVNTGAAVRLMQPRRMQPLSRPATDRGVMQASAHTPLGIQLINPAAAIAVEPDDCGLQQAIYIEASDQPTSLPPVAPTN